MKRPIDTKAMTALLLGALVVLFSWAFLFQPVFAVTGAGINYNSTDPGPTVTLGNRSDARGTITTLVLDAAQQDQYWKGYVGNVTAALTLDDSSGNTIYDWNLVGVTVSGEVYATRSNSVDFGNVQCLNTTNILAEQTFNNMTTTQVDNINNTFNWTTHQSFQVAAATIPNSTCRTAYTYVNSAAPAVSESTDFQEVLLQDNADNIIYVTFIEDLIPGFDNTNYNFQMIVAESDRKTSPTTYYFWTEIST